MSMYLSYCSNCQVIGDFVENYYGTNRHSNVCPVCGQDDLPTLAGWTDEDVAIAEAQKKFLLFAMGKKSTKVIN